MPVECPRALSASSPEEVNKVEVCAMALSFRPAPPPIKAARPNVPNPWIRLTRRLYAF
jgi:hypothetical protein